MTEETTPRLPGAKPMDRHPHALPLDFAAFHQMHRTGYVRYAKSFLHNWADAEEATDAAFERIYRQWSRVLASENHEAYAWQILRNQVHDHERARRRRPLLDAAAFDTAALRETTDPIGQLTESLTLLRAFRELTDRQQDVMVLLHLHDLTPAEIADELGIAAATVRSTARYARLRLAAILDPGHTSKGHTDDLAR
ncbi:RNA polymerase sigma factor [Streptomyces niveus]|uniref:RNA polymerase sigma factor n=1 Tax=Streptomyces niveus TaxID=193462 RepID=UPI0020D27DB5|nr:sigma-70 family RNA polymerase sigma factor [Streptomyces niveus]